MDVQLREPVHEKKKIRDESKQTTKSRGGTLLILHDFTESICGGTIGLKGSTALFRVWFTVLALPVSFF